MTAFDATETGVAEVNGARIAYDQMGRGGVLVLVHAGIADRSMWDAQMPVFAASHRVLRLDLRGYGDSSLPRESFANHDDLRAVLDVLGIERATLLGVSMGGGVVLNTALAYPERVERLILVSTRAGATTVSADVKEVWRESEAAFEAGDLDRATEIELAGWVVGPRRTPEALDPVVLDRARAMIRRIWERAAREGEEAEERELDPPAHARLGEVRVPTLVITGDSDLTDIATSIDALVAGIPGARKVVIDNAAHLPNMEHPDEFNRAVLAFLAETR